MEEPRIRPRLFSCTRFVFAAIAALSAFHAPACDEAPTATIAPSERALTKEVVGMVRSEEGEALQGVSVTVAGRSAVTDHLGCFRLPLSSPRAGRVVVLASHAGYQSAIIAARPAAGGIIRLIATLRPQPEPAVIDASVDALIDRGGVRIEIPKGSLATDDRTPYTGAAEVRIDLLERGAPGFATHAPSDLLGVDDDSARIAIDRRLVIRCDIRTVDGRVLHLLYRRSAKLSVAPEHVRADASVWSLVESDGLWRRSAALQHDGNGFAAHVTALGTLCIGEASRPVTVRGRLACPVASDLELSGIVLDIAGARAATDLDGTFEAVVPERAPGALRVDPEENLGIAHGPIPIETDGRDTVTVGSLRLVPCPAVITGRFVGEAGTGRSGFVRVRWNRQQTTLPVTGSFAIAAAAGVPLTLEAIDDRYCESPRWMMPALTEGAIYDLGTISQCEGASAAAAVDVAIGVATVPVTALVFDPDGAYVAIGRERADSGDAIEIRYVSNGMLSRRLGGTTVERLAATGPADNPWLLASHASAEGGYVRRYSMTSKSASDPLIGASDGIPHSSGTWFLAHAVRGGFAGIVRCAVSGPKLSVVQAFDIPGRPAFLCEDGRSFVGFESSAFSRLGLWRVDGLVQLRGQTVPKRIERGDVMSSHDGSVMAIRLGADSVIFSDVGTGAIIAVRQAAVFAISPDNASLVTIRGIIDLRTGALRVRLSMPEPPAVFRHFAFAGNGSTLAAVYDDASGVTRLRIWRLP